MKVSTGILAVGSIAIGWIQFPSDWSFGPHLFVPWLSQVLGAVPELDPTTGLLLEVLGAVIAIAGVWIAHVMVKKELATGKGIGDNKFLNAAWYIDDLSKLIFIRSFKALTGLLETVIERWILNKGVVGGVSSAVSSSGEIISEGQGNQVSRYVLWMIVGAVILLFYMV